MSGCKDELERDLKDEKNEKKKANKTNIQLLCSFQTAYLVKLRRLKQKPGFNNLET
jgi:hypothetical protein